MRAIFQAVPAFERPNKAQGVSVQPRHLRLPYLPDSPALDVFQPFVIRQHLWRLVDDGNATRAKAVSVCLSACIRLIACSIIARGGGGGCTYVCTTKK